MAEKALVLEDDDFLALVGEEYRQSVGFDNDEELAKQRERALEYMKGEMPDLPALPNRSSAVSTDFPDAVETILPDLMEVLTGGDDVATFRPVGEEDVEAAAQETDYCNHVLFAENDGWRVLYSKIKDALISKIGVVKVWGEEYEDVQEESFAGKTSLEVELASQGGGEVLDLVATEPDPVTGEPLWNFTLRRVTSRGKACVKAVPPEDFAVGRDTVLIADATYCAMRSRPRAQDLIADGYDKDEVEGLPAYGSATAERQEVARDTAGEHADGGLLNHTAYNLHQVEIVEHYVRVDADGDGKPELWCVVTGGHDAVLLKKERVDRIPFAVSTPFIQTHRLFGQSLYDKLGEIQRIKTALVRMMLDSGWFALNQRYEVSQEKMGKTTLADLLNNVPGAPILSQTGDAVRPIGGGRLDFDVTGALEYVSTMAEQRSGVVRNAQGLNPDTLHDTARGAAQLANAAQKRVRMIARVFAETGIKDLFLLIHAVVRSTATSGAKVRLRGKWVEVDPTSWGARNDMTVEVGIGSGGRDLEMAALGMIRDAQRSLVELQGGAEGPFVKPGNIYNLAKRLCEVSGLKGVDKYFSDPADAPAMPPQPPPPDPKLVEVEQRMELERYKIDKQHELQREKMAGEFELRKAQMRLEARLAVLGPGGDLADVHMGGELG